MLSDSGFNAITYESIGINPVEYYNNKFVGGAGHGNFLASPENAYDIEYDRARFLASQVVGPKVLDVGCGTAPYAGTLRAVSSSTRIVGVDLDPVCVEVAKEVYDKAMCFELGKKLPFKDGEFNTVFSCDVFGHIEFRHKDAVIDEIYRVTVSGGKSVHIIESGYLNYDLMEKDNPDDPIRKYVWMEGHIGIETAQSLKKRWSRLFSSVKIQNASIYPIFPMATYLADPKLPEDLKLLMEKFTSEQRKAVQIMLGYISMKLRSEISEEALFPDHLSSNPLKFPSGLVYLIAEK